MDVFRTRFLKLMTGDFAHDISILEKFAKSFDGNIAKGFNLKVPSGETWRIGVKKVADVAVPHVRMGGFCQGSRTAGQRVNDILFFSCNGVVSLMY
ncbi:hypothetical protein ABZP36_034029 [Zizania latifolia]